ncbi:hypothetical protein, partial [Bacillus sp. JJ722]|uniref:hypothetical protein n=1 Tax=Bacillus sp. JJ722 TaxID=3122973 RepID=UPI002FFF35D3
MNNITVQEITKSIINKKENQKAREKFLEISSKKGELTSFAANLDMKNAKLTELDFRQIEELKDLGVVKSLNIPTTDGNILYAFNDSHYGIQTYKDASHKKDELLNKLKDENDFKILSDFIIEQGGHFDPDSIKVIHSKKELGSSNEIEEDYVLSGLIHDVNSQETIGQVLYNATNNAVSLSLRDEEAVVVDGDLEVSPYKSCLVSWMNCMLKCICSS